MRARSGTKLLFDSDAQTVDPLRARLSYVSRKENTRIKLENLLQYRQWIVAEFRNENNNNDDNNNNDNYNTLILHFFSFTLFVIYYNLFVLKNTKH